MIQEGERAPSFELPGVMRGRPGWVGLDGLLGESVVVLVFYPADFNPSCTDETTDLDEFDIFRMQSDATVLAISGDSVYSHRAFADAYDIRLPLLADVDGDVARAYGVETDDSRYTTRRAVVVIDHDGVVTYAWVAADIEDRPDIESVQRAFQAIDDADLAKTQYREGCDRYTDARESFVEGMQAYRQREWVLACGAFDETRTALRTATEQFERAMRFSEDEAMTASFERGNRAATEFERGIRLLYDAASAHANGQPRRGERLRDRGQSVLESIQELGAPPDPDALPVDTEEPAGNSGITLDIDLEAEVDATDDTGDESGEDAQEPPDTDAEPGESADRAGDIDESNDLDEDDLEALTAEIETQDVSEE